MERPTPAKPEPFQQYGSWCVDRTNWMAAVTALAQRQPGSMLLVEKDNPSQGIPFPILLILQALTECKIRVRLMSSFYKKNNDQFDNEELVTVMSNPRLKLQEFFGHLDGAGMAMLPHSLDRLGLSICTADDAANVNHLVLWKELVWFHVSVSPLVSTKDLRPLPRPACLTLHFHGITKSLVLWMTRAIKALVPDKRFLKLVLRRSELTCSGVQTMALQLRGVTVSMLVIESLAVSHCERRSVKVNLESAMGCSRGIVWQMPDSNI